MINLNTPADKVFTLLSTDLSHSSGCHLESPEWPEAPPEPWPKVLAARAPDVTVNKGLGLGGPCLGEDWFLPWLVFL